jgi:hypothetical protein
MATPVAKVAYTGPLTPKGSNLFSLINGLRHFGKGAKVTRDIFKFPETYYIITKVKLSKDQDHGDIWGKMVWRGIRKTEQPKKLASVFKKQWTLLDLPDYSKFHGTTDEMDALLLTHGMETIEI